MKKMIKKEKEDGYKITATIYTNEEMKRLDHKIEFDLDNIVDQITNAVSKERETIVLQKVIEKQQKKIKKLKEDLKEERNFSKSALETLKDCVHKDTIKKKMSGEINKDWKNTEQRKCQLYAYDILKELLGE